MKRKILTAGAFLLSAALIAIGLAGGQQMDVLNKAIYICLECVGIG